MLLFYYGAADFQECRRYFFGESGPGTSLRYVTDFLAL